MKMDDLRVPHDLGNLYVPRPQTAPYCAKLLPSPALVLAEGVLNDFHKSNCFTL